MRINRRKRSAAATPLMLKPEALVPQSESEIIRIFNVTKNYGRQLALHNLSFDVNRGEMVFLTGPSGAGKTTLIKLILCEEPITQGQILVDNVNLKRITPRLVRLLRRRIGVVFQDFKLIPSRTVFQNVALRLEIDGSSPVLIGKKVRYILKRVGLEGKDQAFPLHLSGGEQQRVAIARAIVGDPDIILADEPTGNLDINLTMDIIGLLEEINSAGATVLMATHNQEILRTTTKRLIRLDKGRLAV
jgi:cell division transport system ATP-binding protein